MKAVVSEPPDRCETFTVEGRREAIVLANRMGAPVSVWSREQWVGADPDALPDFVVYPGEQR